MKNIILFILLLFILSCCTVTPEEPEWVDAIFIMDDDGGNVTYLADGNPGSIQFAPDDLKLIINRGASGIWSMNTDGSEYKAIIDTISGGSSLPSIYTDSLGCTKIAFASGDIYIMDIDGTNLQNLTKTPDVRDRYPHFSPDGDSIVYTTDSDTLITISIIDKNGESSRIIISDTPSTKLAQVYYYPRFNINGDKIYYKFLGELKGLYSINTDGTNNSLLFDGHLATDFLSMPDDGSKLIFSCNSHIYMLNIEDSGIMDLGLGGGATISRDGSKIVFGGVKIMNSDGSGLTKLEYGGHPSFSHNKYNDHYKIVYIGERQINKKNKQRNSILKKEEKEITMKKILSYSILLIAVFFTANLYGQIGTIIPDSRLPYENDGETLSWTLAGYEGNIPYAEETIVIIRYKFNNLKY